MKIQKSDLIKKMKPLKAAIGSKMTGNIEGVLFKDNKVFADNFEYTLAAAFPCKEDPFVLPKKAIEMIETFPEEKITIMPCDVEVFIESSAGNSKFTTVPAEKFILSNSIDPDECAEANFSGCTLTSMLELVVYACATDNSVYSGVLIEAANGELNVVAMDGYRLSWAKTKQNGDFRAVIPAGTVAKLTSLVNSGNVKIRTTKTAISIATDTYTIITKQLQGNFVDYKAAIPKVSTSDLVVKREDLISTLQRAQIVTVGNVKTPVIFESADRGLTIKSFSGTASFDAVIPVERKDDNPVKIGLNPRYLLDALKAFDTDTVHLLYGGEFRPLLVAGEMLSALILPVKIR